MNLDDCTTWPKAWDEEYMSRTFFYRDGDFVHAWTSDLARLKSLFYSILESLPEQVEFVFMRRDEPNDPRQRFFRSVLVERLVESIKANEQLVFQDSRAELFIKNAETGEHVLLDENGGINIRSRNPACERLCELHGFPNERPFNFIHNRQHARYEPPDHELLAAQFISLLGLRRIEDYPD